MDNLSEELWELAADYFVAAGAEQTREILEERVSGLDWRGNTKLAERIISICDKHDLLNAKYDITRAVTLKYSFNVLCSMFQHQNNSIEVPNG